MSNTAFIPVADRATNIMSYATVGDVSFALYIP